MLTYYTQMISTQKCIGHQDALAMMTEVEDDFNPKMHWSSVICLVAFMSHHKTDIAISKFITQRLFYGLKLSGIELF